MLLYNTKWSSDANYTLEEPDRYTKQHTEPITTIIHTFRDLTTVQRIRRTLGTICNSRSTLNVLAMRLYRYCKQKYMVNIRPAGDDNFAKLSHERTCPCMVAHL